MWFWKKRDPIEEFWAWFAANAESFRAMNPPNDRALKQLHGKLAEVKAGLVPEFALENGVATTLVISADGNRALFPDVVAVVRRAPELPGWRIVAFRQPGRLTVAIEMHGQRLGAADLWFSTEQDGAKTGVNLFVRGLTDDNRQLLGGAAFLLLDNALGEYLVETAIGFVDFHPLPEEPGPGLRPFPELVEAIKPVRQ